MHEAARQEMMAATEAPEMSWGHLPDTLSFLTIHPTSLQQWVIRVPPHFFSSFAWFPKACIYISIVQQGKNLYEIIGL